MKTLKTSKFFYFVLLAVGGCIATFPSQDMQIIQRGTVSIVSGSKAQVQELCSTDPTLKPVETYILGCWIPSTRMIVIQAGDTCIALHEALHALGWNHGPLPHSGCGLE